MVIRHTRRGTPLWQKYHQGVPQVDPAENSQVLDWVRGTRRLLQSVAAPYSAWVRSPRRRGLAHGCCSGGSDGTAALGPTGVHPESCGNRQQWVETRSSASLALDQQLAGR